MSIKKNRLRLGIVPLCDAAPLIVAAERGFFAEQGLEVQISREASWATIRDKVALGALDGAQMLATMPFSTSLGLGNLREPMVTALALSLGGNAITVSNDLFDRMRAADPQAMEESPLTARALKAIIAGDRAQGRGPMTFAMVYPFSTHTYEIRYWMAAAGIDPDRDVRLVVIPPPQMVANLSAGTIDGYCVGAPWNGVAASLGLGRTLITSQELWCGRVEKVLGMRQAWIDAHPQTHRAVLRAVLQAAQWADRTENRAEVAEIIAQPAYINAPLDVVRASLRDPEELPFFRHAANFPWRAQGLWDLTQRRRGGHLRGTVDLRRTAEQVFRSDLYRLAALELGLPVPLTDSKTEGSHGQAWVLADATNPIPMGPDAFFDGAHFDPASVDGGIDRSSPDATDDATAGATP